MAALVLVASVSRAQGPIPDVPINPVPEDGGIKTDELGQTALELVLNLQKFSVIAAGKNIILNNNVDLLASYRRLKDIADGNFKLHEHFIETVLVKVKDEVKNHSKALQLLEVLQAIRQEAGRSRDLIASAGVFSPQELLYYRDSYTQLYREAGHLITEFTMTITDGELKANDGERLIIILDVYQDAVGLYNSLRSFNDIMRVTVAQRGVNQQEQDHLTELLGL